MRHDVVIGAISVLVRRPSSNNAVLVRFGSVESREYDCRMENKAGLFLESFEIASSRHA